MSAPSARGLFRATGKASRPVAVLDDDGAIVIRAGLQRRKDEFYATPAEATRAFLSAELPRLRSFPAVWEPAAGDGAMARELAAVGLAVVASDLVDRGCGAKIRSFYEFAEPAAPACVTNPPFAECDWKNGRGRWVAHALFALDVDYLALLLPWTWPAAGNLAPLLARRPFARAYLMRWRIDWTGQGGPPSANGWFVWDRAHAGAPAYGFLDRADARQAELFGDAPC